MPMIQIVDHQLSQKDPRVESSIPNLCPYSALLAHSVDRSRFPAHAKVTASDVLVRSLEAENMHVGKYGDDLRRFH